MWPLDNMHLVQSNFLKLIFLKYYPKHLIEMLIYSVTTALFYNTESAQILDWNKSTAHIS